VQKLSEDLLALSSANTRLAAELQSSRLPIEDAANAAKKRLDELESKVYQLGAPSGSVASIERRLEELSGVYAKIGRQEEALAALKAELARLHNRTDDRQSALGEALAKGMREAHQETDKVRAEVGKLECFLPERIQELQQTLQPRLDAIDAAQREAEGRRVRDVEALQDKLKVMEASRAAENSSVRESIIQATVEDEKRWQQVLEQFAVERAAKDKHQDHVMGLFDQEREARARQLEITPAFRDLNEALRERVDELHRSVHAMESMFRKDVQERAEETASLWTVIDEQQQERRRSLDNQSPLAARASSGDDAGGLRGRRPHYKGHALMSFISEEGYGAGPDVPKGPPTSPKRISDQLECLQAAESAQLEDASA